MMKSKWLFAITTLLLIVSCGCNKSSGKEADEGKDIPSGEEGGGGKPAGFQRYVKDLVLNSKTLREYVKYSVYLPADYETATDTRYPVVYMLHGLGDDNNSWNGNYLHANAKVDELEAKGLTKMIYVFPKGFASYYCNFYDGSYNYMDMFVNELVPLIDSQYRTLADKQHRSITGYSMGGFGACALAEKHPEVFNSCAPLSMSVRTDWQYLEESQSGWDNQWGMIFGGVGQSGAARITEYYRQHCPIHYFNAQNKESLSTVHWYLICGDDEKNLLYANDQLHCVMRDNGYSHEYRVVNGGHSSSVWMPALDEVLPLFDYYMNGNQTLWTPALPDVMPAAAEPNNEDGSWASPKFKETGSGTALYIAYKGSVNMKSLFYALQIDPAFDNGYILLPCNLEQKDLAAWMQEWSSKYTLTKNLVLGIGEGAAQALALPTDTFKRHYFINPQVEENVHVVYEQEIYFAGTDVDSNYWGMNALYNACKKAEAKFEYRVVKGYKNSNIDTINSLATIKSLLYY